MSEIYLLFDSFLQEWFSFRWNKILKRGKKVRGHPGLNQRPIDLQSIALPLSYIPIHDMWNIQLYKHK